MSFNVLDEFSYTVINFLPHPKILSFVAFIYTVRELTTERRKKKKKKKNVAFWWHTQKSTTMIRKERELMKNVQKKSLIDKQ